MERTKAPLDLNALSGMTRAGIMQHEDVIEVHRKLGRVSDHVLRQMRDTCVAAAGDNILVWRESVKVIEDTWGETHYNALCTFVTDMYPSIENDVNLAFAYMIRERYAREIQKRTCKLRFSRLRLKTFMQRFFPTLAASEFVRSGEYFMQTQWRNSAVEEALRSALYGACDDLVRKLCVRAPAVHTHVSRGDDQDTVAQTTSVAHSNALGISTYAGRVTCDDEQFSSLDDSISVRADRAARVQLAEEAKQIREEARRKAVTLSAVRELKSDASTDPPPHTAVQYPLNSKALHEAEERARDCETGATRTNRKQNGLQQTARQHQHVMRPPQASATREEEPRVVQQITHEDPFDPASTTTRAGRNATVNPTVAQAPPTLEAPAVASAPDPALPPTTRQGHAQNHDGHRGEAAISPEVRRPVKIDTDTLDDLWKMMEQTKDARAANESAASGPAQASRRTQTQRSTRSKPKSLGQPVERPSQTQEQGDDKASVLPWLQPALARTAPLQNLRGKIKTVKIAKRRGNAGDTERAANSNAAGDSFEMADVEAAQDKSTASQQGRPGADAQRRTAGARGAKLIPTTATTAHPLNVHNALSLYSRPDDLFLRPPGVLNFDTWGARHNGDDDDVDVDDGTSDFSSQF